jgi:hypothetical protein
MNVVTKLKKGFMQEEVINPNPMPRIGEKAPAFKANTTQGKINFPQQYAGEWVILFSHPCRCHLFR